MKPMPQNNPKNSNAAGHSGKEAPSNRYLAYRLDSSCLPDAGAASTLAPTGAQTPPEVFVPTLFRLFLPGEKRTLKRFLSRFYFALMTRFRMRIYYVRAEDGGLAHKSCLIPKCFKFPFLGADGYEIGPCLTHPAHRRKGLYVHVLRSIVASGAGNVSKPQGNRNRYYMFVHESNLPSIKGIERAGFSRIGFATASRWLKIYRLECQEGDELERSDKQQEDIAPGFVPDSKRGSDGDLVTR